jgi:molybdopterin-guanine dinucleotide biosynthesis protein A
MTGVILAGGRNSRIGQKKAFLEIGGKRIVDRTVEIYKKIFKEILIITNTPEDYQYLKFENHPSPILLPSQSSSYKGGEEKGEVKIYTDLIPHKGSLGGIYTGLYYSKSDYAFFTACDMPFLNEKVIKHIIKWAKDYDIIVPYFKRRLHPLHAVYSKRCLPIFKEMVEEDRLKIKGLFSKFKVKRVTDIPETKLPPFFNINTIEDYKKAVSSRS